MSEPDDLLTLQDAADELMVHYMTAYRWVRRGDLPAFKAGGRIRVKRADLELYKESRRVNTATSVRPRPSRRDWDAHVDRLTEQLLTGKSTEAFSGVRKVLGDGATASEIYLKLLAPALERVGDKWESGEALIADEHRATLIATGIMTRLSDHFRRRGPRSGVAVTTTAPGEQHGIGIAMVADFMRSAGWEVHHLGTSVPMDDLRLFLDMVGAQVVCVSSAQPLEPSMYGDLAALGGGRQVVLGGKGTDPAIAAESGLRHFSDPLSLMAFLENERV